MRTPSQRIWAQPDEKPGTGPAPSGRVRTPLTLRVTAERIAGGLPLRAAVADFLGDLRSARDLDDIAGRLAEPPSGIAPEPDAYLGALAEHVAAVRGVPVPRWAVEPSRFLDRFW